MELVLTGAVKWDTPLRDANPTSIDTMDDTELRTLAIKRVKAKSDFYGYLLVWLGVSVIVTVIWALSDFGGYFWPGWVIAGMGIAAFFQGIGVFGPAARASTDAKIEAEMERLRRG